MQLDIWRIAAPKGRARTARLVVVLQHRHLQDLDTRIVAPLVSLAELPAIGRLRPEIALGRNRYRLVMDRLSAVRRQDLSEQVGTVEAHGEPIRRALDQLFYGV